MFSFFFFFFSSRRRHTRFDCDWSSDVCSSDLSARWRPTERIQSSKTRTLIEKPKIGRASCRERVYISVVAVSLKKKKKKKRVKTTKIKNKTNKQISKHKTRKDI